MLLNPGSISTINTHLEVRQFKLKKNPANFQLTVCTTNLVSKSFLTGPVFNTIGSYAPLHCLSSVKFQFGLFQPSVYIEGHGH